jgi:hypothetical protein
VVERAVAEDLAFSGGDAPGIGVVLPAGVGVAQRHRRLPLTVGAAQFGEHDLDTAGHERLRHQQQQRQQQEDAAGT